MIDGECHQASADNPTALIDDTNYDSLTLYWPDSMLFERYISDQTNPNTPPFIQSYDHLSFTGWASSSFGSWATATNHTSIRVDLYSAGFGDFFFGLVEAVEVGVVEAPPPAVVFTVFFLGVTLTLAGDFVFLITVFA